MKSFSKKSSTIVGVANCRLKNTVLKGYQYVEGKCSRALIMSGLQEKRDQCDDDVRNSWFTSPSAVFIECRHVHLYVQGAFWFSGIVIGDRQPPITTAFKKTVIQIQIRERPSRFYVCVQWKKKKLYI